jgi:hypothetical protein
MPILAQANKFTVEHEYEVVWLRHAYDCRTVIGDFYGDPRCAVIDQDEKWCAVAGRGIILYRLHKPFDEYQYDKKSHQYEEIFREAGQNIYIEEMRQTSANSFVVKVENGDMYNISLDAAGRAAVQLKR